MRFEAFVGKGGVRDVWEVFLFLRAVTLVSRFCHSLSRRHGFRHDVVAILWAVVVIFAGGARAGLGFKKKAFGPLGETGWGGRRGRKMSKT